MKLIEINRNDIKLIYGGNKKPENLEIKITEFESGEQFTDHLEASVEFVNSLDGNELKTLNKCLKGKITDEEKQYCVNQILSDREKEL